jgi:hypothetical protein
MWSTACGSARSGSAGTGLGCALRSRWTAGPGCCWPPTPNRGSPAAPSLTSGSPGSDHAHLPSSPPGVCCGVLATWSRYSGRRPVHRNPAGVHRDGLAAAAPGQPPASRHSRLRRLAPPDRLPGFKDELRRRPGEQWGEDLVSNGVWMLPLLPSGSGNGIDQPRGSCGPATPGGFRGPVHGANQPPACHRCGQAGHTWPSGRRCLRDRSAGRGSAGCGVLAFLLNKPAELHASQAPLLGPRLFPCFAHARRLGIPIWPAFL